MIPKLHLKQKHWEFLNYLLHDKELPIKTKRHINRVVVNNEYLEGGYFQKLFNKLRDLYIEEYTEYLTQLKRNDKNDNL